MRAVFVLARASIRRQWRALAALALLVGLSGAVVLAAAAGARRTSTSLDRFEAFSRTSDIEVNVGDPTPAQLRALEQEPTVAEVAALRETAGLLAGQQLPTAAPIDGRFGTTVDRPRVVRGRLPNATAPEEVAIGELLASRLHVDLGDEMPFATFGRQQVEDALAGREVSDIPNGPKVQLRVVGIIRRPLDLAGRGARGGVLVLTPAFNARYGDEVGTFVGTVLRVRTRHGAADVPETVAKIRHIFENYPQFDVTPLNIETAGTRDAVHVLTVALALFAAIGALATAVALALITSRQVRSVDVDQESLSALGMTRRERVLAAASLAVPVAVGGAVLAVVGAALLSPMFPLGVARKAEPNPGFRVHASVLAIGFVTIVAFLLVVGVIAAWYMTRASASTDARAPRGSRFARAARSGLAPAVATGVDLALEAGQGRRAAPVRSALVGAIVGLVGIVGATVFVTSFDHLAHTPHAYGWSWDAILYPNDNVHYDARKTATCGDVDAALLETDSEFTALTAACTLNVEVEGRPVTSWGFTHISGTPIEPTIIAGRAPEADDEVALGATTMRATRTHIGDRVEVHSGNATVINRVVGQVVLPSPLGIDPQPLADNAVLTGAGLTKLLPRDESNYDFHVIARFAPESQLRTAPRDATGLGQFAEGNFETPTTPVEVTRLRQVDQLPALLGAFLAVLGIATVGHALLSTARRRRHDLAILRALGFDNGQVRTAVASQATTFALAGIIVGVPLGVLIGARIWRAVASGLGVSTTAEISALTILLACVASLLLVNAVGAIAARRAVRLRPAEALAVE